MTTPAPSDVQAMCLRLHTAYCTQTRRPTPMLPLLQRLWWDLLSSPEYAYDADRFGDDLAHLVRYLLMGIRDDKRNDGALKLINLLQPDRWWEDLAEARAKLRPLKPVPKASAPTAPAPAPAAEPASEATRKDAIAGLLDHLKGAR